MPNLDKLVITAAEFKVCLVLPGRGSYVLLTLESIGQTISRSEEQIYAVGEEDAIANKRNEKKVAGKMNIQVGEISAILQLAGYQESTQIEGATLAITSIIGAFARTYAGMNINTENIDIKAKDKQTMAMLDFTALSVV